MSPAFRTEPKSQSLTSEKSDLEKHKLKLKMFATYHLMTKHQTFQLFELTAKNTWKQMLIKRTWNQMLIQINLKTNDRPKILENKSSSKNAWKQMLIHGKRKRCNVDVIDSSVWRHRRPQLPTIVIINSINISPLSPSSTSASLPAHSCTIFPCYLSMKINAETPWTITKIVELSN